MRAIAFFYTVLPAKASIKKNESLEHFSKAINAELTFVNSFAGAECYVEVYMDHIWLSYGSSALGVCEARERACKRAIKTLQNRHSCKHKAIRYLYLEREEKQEVQEKTKTFEADIGGW